MKLSELLKKTPCEKCPYTLGQVRTPVNPCPQCKLDNYAAYDRFLRMPLGPVQESLKDNKKEPSE